MTPAPAAEARAVVTIDTLKLALKIREAQKTVRSLWGEEYADAITEWIDVLETIRAKESPSVLSAVVTAIESLGPVPDGTTTLFLLAAGAEAIERGITPTPEAHDTEDPCGD